MSISKLASCLITHDYFGAVPDDTPVMLDADGCTYELFHETVSEGGVRLTLGI